MKSPANDTAQPYANERSPDPLIDSQMPGSQDISEHVRTYDKFVHLLGWFLVHIPLLLIGIYVMTLGEAPFGGAIVIFVSIVILIYGVGRTMAS
ncbi:hypothetical protein [Pelagibacterium limicola]|uniref:hypothetical protein n=1 Tax=Pelagibacterium limicola TaxID=2791022 RepID=UPI0018AFDCDE|nr:hypothetical protein [Pelagibacterium limicola]